MAVTAYETKKENGTAGTPALVQSSKMLLAKASLNEAV